MPIILTQPAERVELPSSFFLRWSTWGFAHPLLPGTVRSLQSFLSLLPPHPGSFHDQIQQGGDLLTLGFSPFLHKQLVTCGSPARAAMATPDVSVHMEEVVVVTTPDGTVDGGMEEVKTVLVTTNLSQHG